MLTERFRFASPKCHPFVKWAGGKKQLIQHIAKHILPDFNHYYEPFLGGGAIFFFLVSNLKSRFTATLCDNNAELINTYTVVRDSVEDLISILKNHQTNYQNSPKSYYYELRNRHLYKDPVEKAARTIVLNRTCYCGLYRVNKKGKFNVPIGRYNNPTICDDQNLRNVSMLLNEIDCDLVAGDYKTIMNKAQKGDFIYFDPPYQPTSKTSNYTSYTTLGFGMNDQIELAAMFKELDQRKCYLMLSNSDTMEIRNLYQEYNSYTERIPSKRAINSNGSKRSGHIDLLIRNFA